MIKNLLKKVFWNLPLSSQHKFKFLQRIRTRSLSDYFFKKDITSLNDLTKDAYIKQVLSSPRDLSVYNEEQIYNDKFDSKVRLVAFYLTQFHPTPENDKWWGRGVTEWNNVLRAVPQFLGHQQPLLPGELGCYDLRINDVMRRQVELARVHGVNGFSFYYYWFNGERLLERPLDMFLADQSLEIDFMLCWANESWTRRFDGTNQEVLMKHDVGYDVCCKFIDDVLSVLADKRYIKINNMPALQVYRPENIENLGEVLEYWRQKALNFGFAGLHLIAIKFGSAAKKDWLSEGFDAECQFQPGSVMPELDIINHFVDLVNPDFFGSIYDYEKLVKDKKYKINTGRKVYPAVMPGWDNSARRIDSGVIFQNASPDLYSEWLFNAIEDVKNNTYLDEKMVFINAWNEWGEGAYLEPDKKNGYAFLNATRRTLELSSKQKEQNNTGV